MIRIESLTKLYGETVALDDVTFALEEKGFVFINGISGSGKTTLMNLLSGLDSPTSGEIYYQDKKITEYTTNALDNYRNSEIGIVFQDFNLVDDITVEENLLLPLMIQEITETEKRKSVEEVLSYVGLKNVGKRKGYELSAGQKQRVAIARAIIKKPKVVFADEATGNLDQKNTEQVLKLFNQISKQCLVVLISHNTVSAKKYADRILTLDNGKICKDVDNRQLKELYLEPYRISFCGDNYRKEMCLEEFDIKEEIKEFVDKAGHKSDHYLFQTEVTLEKTQKEEEGKWICPEKVKIKHLPLREIIKCVFIIIKRQQMKNIFVICLFAFISTLYFLASILVNNDYDMSVAQYVQDSGSSLYSIKKSIISENENDSYDVYKGETIYTKLKQIVGENHVVRSLDEIEISKDATQYYVTAFIYQDFFETLKITGNWPINQKEIVLSKQFAEEADIRLGDSLTKGEEEYDVVGICDFSTVTGENCVVVSADYNAKVFEENKCINLQACDIVQSVSLGTYVSEIATIGNNANVTKEKIIWGRMPEKDNEIIVSDELLVENGMTLEDGFVTKYRLPDLQDEKYRHKYDNFINMHRYLGKNVEIVGVYCADGKEEYGDILIDDRLYYEIINYYKEYLNFDCYYVNFENDSYQMIKQMSQDGFYLSDNVCTHIYAVQNFFRDMEWVMRILTWVMLLMVLFVIISFLSYNIKECSKTVGIYKSMGIQNMDIVKMFMMDNLLLSVISIIIANVMLYIIICFVNYKVFFTLRESAFALFIMNPFHCALMSLTILFIAGCATVIPLIRMAHKESIVLLNREN